MYFAQLLLQKCRTTHQEAGGRASGCLLRFSSLIHGEPGNERRKRKRERGGTRKPARTSEGKKEKRGGMWKLPAFPLFPNPLSVSCRRKPWEREKHHFGVRAVVGLHDLSIYLGNLVHTVLQLLNHLLFYNKLFQSGRVRSPRRRCLPGTQFRFS